jgi:hypothetical protein
VTPETELVKPGANPPIRRELSGAGRVLYLRRSPRLVFLLLTSVIDASTPNQIRIAPIVTLKSDWESSKLHWSVV